MNNLGAVPEVPIHYLKAGILGQSQGGRQRNLLLWIYQMGVTKLFKWVNYRVIASIFPTKKVSVMFYVTMLSMLKWPVGKIYQ